MRSYILVALGIFAMLPIGCVERPDKSAKTSAPVRDQKTAREDGQKKPTPEDAVFSLQKPDAILNLPRGVQKELTLSLDRRQRKDQKITLKVKPPARVGVEPSEVVVGPEEETATFRVTATADSFLGEASLVVTAEPERGESKEIRIPVKVTENSK